MDPKALSGLDPKLRETYERVMGAASPASKPSTPPATDKPIAANPFFTSTSPLTSTPDLQKTPDSPQTASPSETISVAPTEEKTAVQQVDLSSTPTQTVSNPFGPQQPASSFAQPLPSPASVNAATPNEVSTVVRLLYIFGAIVFFIAYTFFWLKIFNYQFPF